MGDQKYSAQETIKVNSLTLNYNLAQPFIVILTQ